METLKLMCSDFLESSLDVDNSLRCALVAEKCELKASKELAKKFFAASCSKICELKEFHSWRESQFDDFVKNLSKNDRLFKDLMRKIQTNEHIATTPLVFSKDLFQAISKSFFIAGYLESIASDNSTSSSRSNAIANNHASRFSIPEPMTVAATSSIIDAGLFIIAKSRNGSAVDFYSISETSGTRKCLPKYGIKTDGINTFTMRIFPHKNRIYMCYSTRGQQLQIKCWCFETQAMTDVLIPATVQYIKPRFVNEIGGEILVSEEKYVTWPYEGFKITACKFGLESESYKSIEFNYDNLKEIIYFEDEIFVFSSQKSEVMSFDMNTTKSTPRGSLNKNGIVKAVIFHGNLYVGCYIRTKCYLYVERYDKKNNHWNIVGSICTYTEASSFHIGATDNYLYVFYGKGKIQRYNDACDRWTTLDFSDNFDQIVLCVSTSPFMCVNDDKF
ncbi:uncharacterized protein LOC129565647 [Sitodiplosis mosellana]|uniref:uncharacterized protein LOC129565647 n=1 Tax=Sitodiplosis mosellana TaxID=263140 RepID=UPI0024447569|nr:uncharacterized protein LOC129565647 [Sitodiplosis mosellana]